MRESTTSGFRVELADGSLDIHDLTVGEPEGDVPVVLAVHDLTGNGLWWQCVADEVYRRRGPGAVRFLAPDLRGRGCSRSAPGPFGLVQHAEDLVAFTDVFGVRPVLVGHSMGAFVAALTGATHPRRVAGAVLVDGGFGRPLRSGADGVSAPEDVLGAALARLSRRFDGPDDYLELWREHPTMGPVLAGAPRPEVRRHLLHDLVRAADGDWASSCRPEAVRADGEDLLSDEQTHGAARRAVAEGVPVEVVRIGRGPSAPDHGLAHGDGVLALDVLALDVPAEVVVTVLPDSHPDTVLLEPQGVSAIVDALERRLWPSRVPAGSRGAGARAGRP